ncbi:universal stress protein [Desulfosarcina variabilis str. Montpellier]|jgi:nucleotide-binding universal stress UspA family protein|uniref:universal stress protein n=1 Tax=Desulfosarcina variabilis TaxID=2300 RepID=UPI003AFA8BBC
MEKTTIEIHKILFPVDLTENSSKLLPYVLSFSEKYNSTVYLLHVVQDLNKWGKLYVPHPSMDKFQGEAIDAAKKTLEHVCDDQLQSCPNFTKIVVAGDPADEILKAIETEGIDLLVMGTHGRRGLEHMLFGSVAEKVVKQSPIPVVSINPYKLP